jgi:hypothetical protein
MSPDISTFPVRDVAEVDLNNAALKREPSQSNLAPPEVMAPDISTFPVRDAAEVDVNDEALRMEPSQSKL